MYSRRTSLISLAIASMGLLAGPAMAIAGRKTLMIAPDYQGGNISTAKRLKPKRFKADKSGPTLRRKVRRKAKRRAA